MTRSGWGMTDSLTKATNLLVHADDTGDSVKIRKAKKDGVQTYSLTEFKKSLA